MAAKPGRKTIRPVAKTESSPRSIAPAEATVLASLASMGSVAAAAFASRFFKTGIGQYGEAINFLASKCQFCARSCATSRVPESKLPCRCCGQAGMTRVPQD